MVALDGQRELVDRLTAIPILAGLPDEAIEALVAATVLVEYGPNESVFLEGEPSPGLFIVESGYIKVVKMSVQGREHTLEMLGPTQPANAVSVFTSQPCPASAFTLEPTRAWLLRREVVRALLKTNSAFAERVIENMAEHMIRLVDLVADLSLRSVSERLAKLLLDEAVEGVVTRPRWLTLPEISSRLGTVPDVVQRALGRLSAEGLIDVDRREIRIINRRGLEETAG